VNVDDMERAIEEAKRFLLRANEAQDELKARSKARHNPTFDSFGHQKWRPDEQKCTAAARRASLDLTRALAQLRRR
jgi:hypothetical protein